MLDLLKEVGKLGCKPVDTPIEFNHGLCDTPDDPMIDRGSYQGLVGKLIYLAHTRRDIAFAMSVASQFMHNPKEIHLKAVQRTLKYLKSTLGGDLVQERRKHDFRILHWRRTGSLVDRRLTLLYSLRRKLMTWRSKK